MPFRVENTVSPDTCKGYQLITGLSAALGLTVTAGVRYALMTCEVQSLRYRSDGVAPTVSNGMLMVSGQSRIIALNDWTKFKAIELTPSSSLFVEYYGDPA